MVVHLKEKQARFWKVIVIVLGLISLFTGLLRISGFWSSYLLDITGPAWAYVLIRVQYNGKTDRFLNLRFSPEFAFLCIVTICFLVEAMQYLRLYHSTFDPVDLLAYFSGTFVFYLIDKTISKRTMD